MTYTCPIKRNINRREYYAANKEKLLRKKKLRLRETRAWIAYYLRENPCVDCGETDPIVLEFDHQRDKLFAIGEASGLGKSLEKVKAEVDKCQVRCANCHRRKTYIERGHTYKDMPD